MFCVASYCACSLNRQSGVFGPNNLFFTCSRPKHFAPFSEIWSFFKMPNNCELKPWTLFSWPSLFFFLIWGINIFRKHNVVFIELEHSFGIIKVNKTFWIKNTPTDNILRLQSILWAYLMKIIKQLYFTKKKIYLAPITTFNPTKIYWKTPIQTSLVK